MAHCYGNAVWKFLKKKKKMVLLYELAIPLFGVYPKELNARIWNDGCTRMFAAALFTMVKR